MADIPARSDLETHSVHNQPGVPAPRDLWRSDAALQDHALALGGSEGALASVGAAYGTAELAQAALQARRDPPRLISHDAAGRRLDEVAFHPGYHQILSTGVQQGYVAGAWETGGGGHLAHAVHVYMLTQVEPGCCCPLTMSYAAQAALAKAPELQALWGQKLLSRRYDPRVRPVTEKAGVTMGMAMTEKQGGSDLRRSETRAEADEDGLYRLYGHKWFCSAPMSDGFLTLAQSDGGLSAFMVPRWLEGERNGISLIALKPKLGNHANASAEIEFDDALAARIGDEGAGLSVIMQMVHHTRLDTAMAPAGLMRAALRVAYHWVCRRKAFGATLIDQPLMQAVLADLVLDAEGALALGLHMAQLMDNPDADDQALARLGVALAKFLNNKRCVPVVAEALEMLGGSGYVERSVLPMLYREAPLNGLWEGASNVICLDVLRSLQKLPRAAPALAAYLDSATGRDPLFDMALRIHRKRWPSLPEEAEARWFAESLASLMTGAALLKTAPQVIAEAYVATRLSSTRGSIAGAVGTRDLRHILHRLDARA
ncbi:acyl-CoA dehydrogenase family protein [Cognatishimia sp. SS12]|uniref:acyl-CoA dehydrogenase family protein n=1 Tax=Cognatishimia sp. SS12 TaxID=2979465 RepID=UPI00232F1AA2|nr:acyl-CoA dehydrogenase family protein [Cognatishimia sp. SS12]MDC0737511.1 acyl-CoA dehydrogenase family protein [Cognatishimia sp. SS12]